MLRGLLWSVGLAGAIAAGPLAAQQFDVGPRLGYVKFEEGTGLTQAGLIGLDAVYRVSPRIGVGVRFDVGRPSTNGDFFPAELTFGDTTLIMAVKQPVMLVHYSVQAQVETGGKISAFAGGSAGGYTLTLDAQTARGRSTLSEFAFTAGGGVRLQTGSGTSVRLEVQDLILVNYQRNALNPVDPRFVPVKFPDVLPPQPEFDGTAHNLYLALAFTFTPGGAR
jgi:hypothetical protein